MPGDVTKLQFAAGPFKNDEVRENVRRKKRARLSRGSSLTNRTTVRLLKCVRTIRPGREEEKKAAVNTLEAAPA